MHATWPRQDAVESSLRETVNVCIDAVVSTLQRLLELPVLGVMAALGALALVLFALAWRSAARGAPRWRQALLRGLGVALLLAGLLFVLDRKLRRQHERWLELRDQTLAATAAVLERQAATTVARPPLVDAGIAAVALSGVFGRPELHVVPLDLATDLVRFRLQEPLVRGALAVVDLAEPHLGLAMDADFTRKTMTSDFGRGFRCTVAINGEAGNSPQPDCGLGRWQGHLRIAGQDRLAELPGNPRPFLAFDRQHRARFVAAAAADRALRVDDHDVIWGRTDAIVDGEVRTEDWRFNQPRTVMGIDRDGRRLFLLVVDGRQMGRSVGFTRAQVGTFLRAFGVHGAMLCDEGGSACLYADAFGGLVTTPSDDEGTERPTYTHFGIVRRP